MKNVNGNENEISTPKKLTVDDLKKVIGATAQPRRDDPIEEKGTGKIVL